MIQQNFIHVEHVCTIYVLLQLVFHIERRSCLSMINIYFVHFLNAKYQVPIKIESDQKCSGVNLEFCEIICGWTMELVEGYCLNFGFL